MLDGPCAGLRYILASLYLAFVVTSEGRGRRKLDSEKKVYATPRLKAIYSAPRLTKHGSVAKLTLASILPPGVYDGNQNQGPPPISSPAVLGNDGRPAIDPVTGRPVVDGGGVQKASDSQPQGGGGQQKAIDNQPQGGGGQQKPIDSQPQGGGGGNAKEQ